MKLDAMPVGELKNLLAELKSEYDAYKSKGKKLTMARGIPGTDQIDLSQELVTNLLDIGDCKSAAGVDCRTYDASLVAGLPEMRALFAELYGLSAESIIVGGNASLNMIYDALARLMLFGAPGGVPWCREKIKFLCPSPGYDRHFKILETFGIEMITVPMLSDGPDMDMVEELALDPAVRGILCVPKYQNPTGVVFSPETVRRLAAMKTAADFRIVWDNAYAFHYVYQDTPLADIFAEARKYGTEDRVLYFSSTSKITFPGGGVAFMALSDANRAWALEHISVQTIGPDKLNQLRHVKFMKNPENVARHMAKQAELLRPKFDIVLDTLKRELGPYEVAQWGNPGGGYFISLDVPEGCARAVHTMVKDAGVLMTPPGATYPYGKEPADRNLRIAPTFPPVAELKDAIEVLCLAVKIVAIEKILKA